MKQILISLAACFCIAATIASPSNAQDLERQERLIRQNSIVSRNQNQPAPEPTPYQRSEMAQRELASAQSDEEKSKAKETLSKALSDCFDQDVENRKQELESIRTRLAEMETQLKKRMDGKDDIVRLRLQVLANNANGLGWADPSNRPIRLQLNDQQHFTRESQYNTLHRRPTPTVTRDRFSPTQ